MDEPWIAVEGAEGVFVRFGRTPAGRTIVRDLMITGGVTADLLRSIPIAALERQANRSEDERLPDVSQLRRVGDPADFARHVADVFRQYAAIYPNPAAVISARSGVKLPTVHTWIREARLRGLLPPAVRGKNPADDE